MMKVTIEKQGESSRIFVEGSISGPWVAELERCWKALCADESRPAIQVELADVTFIDDAGKELLSKMASAGTRLRAEGCLTSAIVDSIFASCPNKAPAANARKASRGKSKLLSVFLLLLPFAASRARAQQKPPLDLNLNEAVRIALRQNPEVQIAALSLAQSQKDSAIALSALLPQANLDVSDRAVRSNIKANIGVSIPGFPEHVGPFQVFQAGADFSMPIFDLTLWRRWQASRREISGSDAQRDSARQQIVLLVVSQYLDCLRAGAQVQAAQSRVRLAQALYDQSADLQNHGVATGVDTLRANVELQNEKQRLIEAETQQKIAVYGLSRLLNLDPRQNIELADEKNFFQTPETAPEESLGKAYAARPEMKSLLAEQQALEYRMRAASESRLPALRFDGVYAQQGLSSHTVIPTYTYQASVDMPLVTSGRIRSEVARDHLELKKAAQRIQDEREQIALEVRSAAAQLTAARNEVTVANLGVALAEEEVRQSRDRFQAGVADNIEVVSAQDALARANDNQIAALYRYNQSRADFARATGQIESLYTK